MGFNAPILRPAPAPRGPRRAGWSVYSPVVDTAEPASEPASPPAPPPPPPPPGPVAPAKPAPQTAPGGLRYWRRSLVLAVVVVVLLVLSWWDERRLPDTPVGPSTTLSTPFGTPPRD